MRAQALVRGTTDYLSFLVRTLLFPFIWMWAMAVARKHRDTDVRAVQKVAVAMVAGVVLTGAAFFALDGFADDAVDGMYTSMGTRLAEAVGESAYQEQLEIISAKQTQIGILTTNLAAAREAGDDDTARGFEENLTKARGEKAAAEANTAQLAGNHALYEQVTILVMAKDDAGIKALIDGSTVDPQVEDEVFEKGKMDSRTARAFRIKDSAQADLGDWMNYLLLPGLAGVFFAPLVLALGNVLGNAWEPSETVGFKKYPGGAMALFLFFGAFGIPALFFAAWTFWDLDVRSREGQISL